MPHPHNCPYGSKSPSVLMEIVEARGNTGTTTRLHRRQRCGGDTGWLCDRCKEDYAELRNQALVAALRAAGIEP